MKKSIGLSLILGILHGLLQPVGAVPVVPNFTQGSQTSTTETKTKVSETINSINYNTGYQYSVTGTNVQMDGSSITPGTNSTSNSIDGVTSSWTNLNLNNKPNWTVTTHQDRHFNLQKLIKDLEFQIKQLYKELQN